LKGDIASASGDFAAARAAYEKAQELERKQTNPINDPLLEMKLRDLSTTIDKKSAATNIDNKSGADNTNKTDTKGEH
jgi:hypothetical protein